ncbi:MAG: hypothetical protein ACF8MJ_10160 [Phycisphaerales bacterium JB050]
MNLIKPTLLALACSCIVLSGCGDENTEPASTTPSSTSSGAASTEPSWILASAPNEWREIGDAKKNAAEGEQIVLRGRIGGRTNPITEGSPVFVMMDVSIPSCADGEDDHCAKPWDYCCESKATITANSATVIVVDEEGNPISAELSGLEPLDEVIVVGTVDARPNQDVLTVKATGIHKKSEG